VRRRVCFFKLCYCYLPPSYTNTLHYINYTLVLYPANRFTCWNSLCSWCARQRFGWCIWRRSPIHDKPIRKYGINYSRFTHIYITPTFFFLLFFLTGYIFSYNFNIYNTNQYSDTILVRGWKSPKGEIEA
jgi:hypothetical protein